MDYVEIKNKEEYQIDPIQIKDNEEHPVEMLVDLPHFLEPLCQEEVNEDTRVYPHVGDEYQVEVPNLATEREQMKVLSSPIDDIRVFGFAYPVVLGLAIPVTWTPNTSNHIKEDRGFSGHSLCPSQDVHNDYSSGNVPMNLAQHGIYPECLSCKIEYDEKGDKFSKSAGQDMYCLQKSKALSCSCLKRKVNGCVPLPGLLRYSWTDEEAQTFLLGLYIFGKNLVLLMKFMESKTMGEVLSYYYGEFFRSDAYRRWASCRKARSRRCILGLRIFSGPRQQELLSRLLSGVAREIQDPLLEVFKTFNEGTSDFQQFILSLRSTVGPRVLIEAVGVGKGKYDLTGFALDPSRNHGVSARGEIPIGKACASLSSGDIIKFLTGDFRLSKAKSNDLFWEAVWPRLLSRGWHSEEPKDSLLVGKHALVFLIPGIKKYSRKKLVKGNHYFDSISDVLRKVASEPRLLDFGVEGCNSEDVVKLANGWIHDIEPDKSTPAHQNPPCYIRTNVPGCSSELMKFTVVDTSLVQGEEPCKVRSLRNLPTDISHGYISLPQSGDSGSTYSEEHLDSEDSSQSYEPASTIQNTTDTRCVNEEKNIKLPADDKMDTHVLEKICAFSGTATSINGHVLIDQCFSTVDTVSSSTAIVLPVGNQKVHSTNSSTEINFQFDQGANPELQVFLEPTSKRRRLVPCKNERTSRKNTADNKRNYWKQVGSSLQHVVPQGNETSAGGSPFIWSSIPNSSANITFNMNNHTYCRQLHNVPPNVETMVYNEQVQHKHVIDLNIPQMPYDYESTGSYILPPSDSNPPAIDRSMYPLENKEGGDNLPCINTTSNIVLGEQLSFISNRQSTRSRPPTTRALEALASGFMGTKQRSVEAFPSSSRSNRPARRPRKLSDVAVPFLSHGEGSNSHFTDPTIVVDEWRMSNPQCQILHSIPSDMSTDRDS